MKHLKIVVLLITILVISFFAYTRVITAFSVGHLTVKQNSERGFLAEVPFQLSKGERGKRVEVSLGGPGHYVLLADERPAELDKMRVRVDRKASKAYIESDTPLRGPLDLIVKVTVDGGTILKKFPIALESALDKTRRAAARLHGGRGGPDPVEGMYGPVRRGETLSQIGRKLAPGGLPLAKAIVALWRSNPRQFAFGNMHALRANSYLDCSNLDAAVAGISLNEARRIIDDQWLEWSKIKSVRAASRRPTPPLVEKEAVARADDGTATEEKKVKQATAEVPSFPTAGSVRHQLEVAAAANQQESRGVRATSERRMVLVHEEETGSLARLQLVMRHAAEMKGEGALGEPTSEIQSVGLLRDEAEAMFPGDLAKLKEEIASTKQLLLGRMSGLEGKFTDRFLRSERINQLFYAIFVVENLVLLVLLLLSMRKRRTRELVRREERPVRSRVYVRNALHQRNL